MLAVARGELDLADAEAVERTDRLGAATIVGLAEIAILTGGRAPASSTSQGDLVFPT